MNKYRGGSCPSHQSDNYGNPTIVKDFNSIHTAHVFTTISSENIYFSPLRVVPLYTFFYTFKNFGISEISVKSFKAIKNHFNC